MFTNQKRDFRGHQLVAMALALGFTRMLIPSGGMRGELRPRATHPELDPRFSTERTRIVHYGDASRIQKVARIARSPQALATVHVCRYNQSADAENCCRCEKCLRTMIQLHALGADASAAFKEPLDSRVVAGMSKEIKHPHQWVDLLHALGDSDEDRRLAAAIRLVIMRADLRNAYERLREMGSDPELAGVREDLPRTVQDTHEAVRHMHRALHPDAHAAREMGVAEDGAPHAAGRAHSLRPSRWPRCGSGWLRCQACASTSSRTSRPAPGSRSAC